ncbi:hypothetical protein [Glycomyces buryatensis]|uniref:Uncharacterized protein n=1 Tax=Glycomyces buryatensis TaxID=2570927 RepID=A0A4S8PR26_9ACTN|nr:hypothetical protein [Glycomyces buryatensis]THV33663.1 hypothetical protein FAB82_26380 [Glycomyces buryatensis]
MDIVAALHSNLEVEPFPGVDDAWLAGGRVRATRQLYLTDRERQVIFQVSVKPETDLEEVRRFLLFARANLDRLWQAVPMVAVPGLRLEQAEFDSAIAVLPAANNLRPTQVEETDLRVYQLFPGCQYEVAMTESESDAVYRCRYGLKSTDWTRDPSPALLLRWGYHREGQHPVNRDQGFTVDAGSVRTNFRIITKCRTGWIWCENFTGREIRFDYDQDTGLTWQGDGGVGSVSPEDAGDLLWTFATGKA